jgi:hypothetical protein
MHGWLLELRAQREKAVARHDSAKAEELKVEIAQVLACLDAVSDPPPRFSPIGRGCCAVPMENPPAT